MVEVKAALCETVECRKDVDLDPAGYKFPGVLTEKYLGHEQERPQASTTVTYHRSGGGGRVPQQSTAGAGRTMMLLGLFAKYYLKTGDRALKVRSCTTKHNLDYTETTVILSLNYSRTDFDPAAVLPLMEQLMLTMKTKEDTTL